MDWIEVTVYTTNEGIEPIANRLSSIGIDGISIEDEKEFLEFLEDNKSAWDYVDEELMASMHKDTTIKFYLQNTQEGLESLAFAKETLKDLKESDKDNSWGEIKIEISNLKEEDWANNWKQYFHPIKIGNSILVKPEWEETDEDDERLVFTINPGMSFGTGSHHTTKMCIEALEAIVKEEDSVLDLGCGSGILSLISLLLGAKDAVAVDIDPMCVNIVKQNAMLNNIPSSKYEVVSGNIITDAKLKEKIKSKKYDIVCANIVADVIISIAPFAYSVLKDGATFICSGIIEDRMAEVENAIKTAGFTINEIKRSADWAAYVCEK